MKIGIIVYSNTGNTLLVGNKIKAKLEMLHKNVTLETIDLENNYLKDKQIIFKNEPDLSKYDVIILGSPVEAFSLSEVVKKYLNKLTNFKHKKVIIYVTEFFPFPWMGGNSAIKYMRSKLITLNAEVEVAGIVNWSNPKKSKMIDKVVEKITSSVL